MKNTINNNSGNVPSKYDLVTVGFGRTDAVMLSFAFRKMFAVRFINICSDLRNLKDMLTPNTIVVCNGSEDFLELDAVFYFAKQKGAAVAACIFTGAVKDSSLAIVQKNEVPVIIADLEDEAELNECIKAVNENQRYISKSLKAHKVNVYSSFKEYFELLTIPERIVCMGILQGYSHKEIATMMDLKKSSVDTYCSRVLAKYELENATQLFKCFAFRNL